MRLAEYFKQVDAPSKNSPVGRLMQKVLDLEPNLSFEEARNRSKSLLNRASSKFYYNLPRIQTSAQMEQEANRLANLRKVLTPTPEITSMASPKRHQ